MFPTQPTLTTSPHNNQRLFSDHYLDVTLPALPNWKLMAIGAKPIMQQIAAMYAAYHPSNNEAQVEREIVRPVLAALGHTFEIQAALTTPHGTKKPDYVLYPDQAAVDLHKNQILDDSNLQGALAVGDAKHWDRPLDVSSRSRNPDPLENKTPSFQIAFYIQHSGLRWGLLTNGRLWRLYHTDTAHKLDRYYEVDLPALLASGDSECRQPRAEVGAGPCACPRRANPSWWTPDDPRDEAGIGACPYESDGDSVGNVVQRFGI